ncbi:MAG: hypothetical protein ACW99G_19885 [Candidatus Thorarchaeota archaeon]|jgi:hypothetical protein
MANPDTPFGLRPAFSLSGGPWNGQTMRCWFSSGEATATFVGDLVDITGTACVKGCCPSIQRSSSVASAAEHFGVMTSVEPFLNGTTQAGMHYEDHGAYTVSNARYRLANEDRFVQVCVDPNIFYLIQGDSATTSAVGNAGSNAIFIETHSGSTVTGLSGIELDVSGFGTTMADGAWAWGTVDMPDHNLGVNDLYYVILNTSIFTGTLGRILGI